MTRIGTLKTCRSTANTPDVTAPTKRSGGPVLRVIFGSLGAGIAAAAALTLGAFDGGSEATITGAALIGFALGWALLAVASARFTIQPQRWAYAPAAALGASGTVLLAGQPDESTITTAGWIWPVALIVGVAWATRRMRASLAGRGRWPLYAVLAATAAAGFGGLTQTIVAATAATPAMPGQLFSVGDHRLHMYCVGTGSPTVLLQAGMGGFSASWARIQP
jgi:hypothetical protein